MIRLGILSAAHGHADAYAEVIADIEGARTVAVADDDAERGRTFADRQGIEHGAREDVLDRVDAGVVCAANADHADWVRAAADAGVDVLCEKPLATSVAAGEGMVAACEDGGVTLGVAMPVRFNEPARRAKAALEAGEVGDLRAVVGTNLLRRMSPGSWFTDSDRSGGGAIMDHTVHVLDLVRWLTGEEVAEVHAESGTLFSDLAVEDTNVLSMELEDGTPVTHDGSWRQPEAWHHWGDVTLRLIGTDGVLEVDCFDQTLDHTHDTRDRGFETVFWGSDMNEGLLRDFVGAVREGREPAVPGREGVRELQVVEAAYASVEAGEPVAV
ncbi:MAG: Gfo/Idh/MocA family protein [Halobacteriales archaeon]